MNPSYYTVGDVIDARSKGLLTKKEARAALADLIPSLRRLVDAKAIVAASKA